MRSVALALALVSVPSVAMAHFQLDQPVASYVQAPPYGDPQKGPPCGPTAAAPGTPVDTVTNYQPGGMITVKVTETITHPGHYRVAIAQDMASLPPPPTITGGACSTAAIAANPTLPILADGLFVNLAPPNSDTVQIPIPANFTCKNCVLQVIEYMSSQTNTNCFYYHCAKVNIEANAPDAGMVTPTPDADTGEGSGSGNNVSGGEISGGCSTGGTTTGLGGLAGLASLVGLVGLRRRRRS